MPAVTGVWGRLLNMFRNVNVSFQKSLISDYLVLDHFFVLSLLCIVLMFHACVKGPADTEQSSVLAGLMFVGTL